MFNYSKFTKNYYCANELITVAMNKRRKYAYSAISQISSVKANRMRVIK